MTKSLDAALGEVTGALRHGLGGNLYSCCVYGSAVRGNAIAGVSDLNLLVVLNESTGAAHQAIAGSIAPYPNVDPFVLPRRGLERTIRCFASKFASIQRNYRVLYGADPLAGVVIDPQLERLLCEQAVRNLRLRLTYAFIMRSPERSYGRFLSGSISAIFVQLAEILRLSGQEVPKEFTERIPLIEKTWPMANAVVRDLVALREHPRALNDDELPRWHARVLALLDAALGSIEQNWTDTRPPAA